MIRLEGCDRLKNNILSLNSAGGIKTIMVASSVVGEGCSTIASNLALSLSKDSSLKVLLIDGNLRNPNLKRMFDLDNDKGISDVILKDVEISDVLKKTTVPNLMVMTSGISSGSPSEVFESQKIKSFITKLKNEADFLIFDSAPVTVFPDSHILASQMDGIVFVVHAGKTRWEVAENAKKQLEMAQAKIIGVALNRKKYVIPDLLYNRL